MLSVTAIATYVQENTALLQALGVGPAGCESVRVAPLGHGEHNANYLLSWGDGCRAVLRANFVSQMGLARQIGYEHQALELLSTTACTPKPLYVDESGQLGGHGVLVMEYRPGSWVDLRHPAQLEEAARIMADIHAYPVLETDGWTDDFAQVCPPRASGQACKLFRPGDPLRAQFETCLRFFRAYRESAFADPEAVRRIEDFAARAQKQLDGEFRPAWAASVVNTEAVPSHFLLCCDDEGAPTAPGCMVDWEKPIVGEAVQDVAYFLSPTTTIWDTDVIFTAAEREAFLHTYLQAAAGALRCDWFERRFKAYAQMNCLIGITWSANAWVEYHTKDCQLHNEKTRALLPRYLSREFLDQCQELVFGD